MIRVLIGCLSICLFATGAFAQQIDADDRLWFDVTMEPDFVASKGTYIGGEIIMHIRFISPDPFKRLRMKLPTVDGARVDVLEKPHTLQIELVNREGYSTLGGNAYSHEARIAIAPMQAGTLELPPIVVTGISEPGNIASFEFEKIHPAREITVHPQRPDFAGDAWVVSRDVTMEETWSHEISEIQIGDTVRRVVTLTVAGATADDLPELTLISNDGHRVLSTEAFTETEKTKTGFVARLEQNWDIYIETEGVTYIDEVQLPYWNPELDKAEVALVPRQRVEPLKRGAVELRETLRDEALADHEARRAGLTVLLSLPAAALILFLAVALWRALPTKADMRFWQAARRSGTPLDFYASFLAWGRDVFGPGRAVGQEQVSAFGDRPTDQVARLHRSLFGPRGGDFDSRRVASSLIWASRRASMARFFSTLAPSLSRFLFLR